MSAGEFPLYKQYSRSSDILRPTNGAGKADILLRREMERMDKERSYVLGSMDKDQRRFQRSLEQLQSRTQQRHGRLPAPDMAGLPGGASPMFFRQSKSRSFDESPSHPLSTSSSAGSTRLGYAGSSPYSGRRGVSSTSRGAGSAISGSPPVSATSRQGRRGMRSESGSRLNGGAAKQSGPAESPLTGIDWSRHSSAQADEDDGTKRLGRPAPSFLFEKPSPRNSPLQGRRAKPTSALNTRNLGDGLTVSSAKQSASTSDLTSDPPQNMSSADEASRSRKQLPLQLKQTHQRSPGTDRAASSDVKRVLSLQDGVTSSNTKLRLVRSSVLFQDGHALAVSLPRLAAASRPGTAKPDMDEDALTDGGDLEVDGLADGPNAQGGKSLAELFDEIKHCRYIRHYRANGDPTSEDEETMAWPESSS